VAVAEAPDGSRVTVEVADAVSEMIVVVPVATVPVTVKVTDVPTGTLNVPVVRAPVVLLPLAGHVAPVPLAEQVQFRPITVKSVVVQASLNFTPVALAGPLLPTVIVYVRKLPGVYVLATVLVMVRSATGADPLKEAAIAVLFDATGSDTPAALMDAVLT